jgi:hypothetical protein
VHADAVDPHGAHAFRGKPQDLDRLPLWTDDPALLDPDTTVILDLLKARTAGLVLRDDFDSEIGSHLEHRLLDQSFQVIDVFAPA